MTLRRFFHKIYNGYSRAVTIAFSRKYLLYTNVLISMGISLTGDLIEQTHEKYTGEMEAYDCSRTLQMGFSGSTAGVLCHNWYIFLDKIITGRTIDMVAKKIMLDQCIFSPIIIMTFFATVAIFEDDPIGSFNEEVREKFWTLYKAEWVVWPPAQVFNFYYLPTRYRVLYDNTISLGYDIYTSHVKHRKHDKADRTVRNSAMHALGPTWRRISSNFRNRESVARLKQIGKIAFSDKYLLYTNVTISVSLSAVGDALEQGYEIYTKQLEAYNIKRTMHMAFSGAGVGVLCHNWYKVLDKVIIGKSLQMVTKKLLLDQLVFSPIMLVTFFGTLAIFEEEPLENFTSEVRDKFICLYRAEWMVWPPAQIINFYFLPTRFRVLYDNTISLGYDVYTSQVKHGKSGPRIS